jgi:hypothetical protein
MDRASLDEIFSLADFICCRAEIICEPPRFLFEGPINRPIAKMISTAGVIVLSQGRYGGLRNAVIDFLLLSGKIKSVAVS